MVTREVDYDTGTWHFLYNEEELEEISSPEIRLDSFYNWPNRYLNPVDMVACGFYYTGLSDLVECFSCLVAINHWQDDDDIWFVHSKVSPYCEHMLAEKGCEFIKEACRRFLPTTWSHNCSKFLSCCGTKHYQFHEPRIRSPLLILPADYTIVKKPFVIV